jgi:hypothetical protein
VSYLFSSRELKKLYFPSGGRLVWYPMILFCCLLLAEWNGLCDWALEEVLEFRIDSHKFAGLVFEEGSSDTTTFVVF